MEDQWVHQLETAIRSDPEVSRAHVEGVGRYTSFVYPFYPSYAGCIERVVAAIKEDLAANKYRWFDLVAVEAGLDIEEPETRWFHLYVSSPAGNKQTS